VELNKGRQADRNIAPARIDLRFVVMVWFVEWMENYFLGCVGVGFADLPSRA
jgi:hypothetical protein